MAFKFDSLAYWQILNLRVLQLKVVTSSSQQWLCMLPLKSVITVAIRNLSKSVAALVRP